MPGPSHTEFSSMKTCVFVHSCISVCVHVCACFYVYVYRTCILTSLLLLFIIVNACRGNEAEASSLRIIMASENTIHVGPNTSTYNAQLTKLSE